MSMSMFISMAGSYIIFSAIASIIRMHPIAALSYGIFMFPVVMWYADSRMKTLSPYQLSILSLANHKLLLYAIRPSDEVERNKGLSQTILKALENKFDSNTYLQIIEDVALEARSSKEINYPKLPKWAEYILLPLIVVALTAIYELLAQQAFAYYMSEPLCKIGLDFLCNKP